MHQVAAVAVEHAAEVIERPRQIEVGDIHVPVLVRSQRLLKTLPLVRRLAFPARQAARLMKDSPDTRGTHRHHVGVQHHEGQPTIAFQREAVVEIDDRSLLPLFQPEVARDPAVVFVHLAVAGAPVVELAGGHAQPAHELLGGDLRPLAPAAYEVDHLVARIVGYPLAFQISPRLFFKATCSSMSSASTSSFFFSLASRKAMRCSRASTCLSARGAGPKAAAPWSKNCLSQR